MSREPSHDESNVTVIEVCNSQHVPHSAMPLVYQGVFNFSFVEDALPSVPHVMPTGSSSVHENLDFREELEFGDTFYTPPVTPARTAEVQHEMPPSLTTEQDLSNLGNSQIEVTDSGSSYYECVFLPSAALSAPSLDSPVSVASNSAARSNCGSDMVEVATGSAETPAVRSLHLGNTVTSTAFTDIQQRRRCRSSSTSEAAASLPSGGPHAFRVAAVTAAETNHSAVQRVDVGRRLQPAPHPYRQAQVCSCSIMCTSYHI
jgi:hypothetical protein